MALPLYPLLIAAYFPLHLMADNLGLFRAVNVVRPLTVAVGAALLALLLVGAVFRDRHRAALWVALALGFICFFFPLQQFFDATSRGIFGTSFSGNVRFGGLLALAVAIGLLARPGATFTKVANVAAAAMLIVPVLTLARDELALSRAAAGVEAAAAAQRGALFGAADPDAARPSIIHIVLDGYSRQDVLRDVYGFDNTAFLDGLRERGFAIATQATTPYTQTLLAMNSVLSAQYLQDVLPDPPADAQRFRQLLSQQLQASHVIRALSGLGYQTAATEVDYDPVRLDQVDRFFAIRGLALTNFEKAAYGQTAVAHLQRIVTGGGTGESIRGILDGAFHRRLRSPFFLYLHLIGPHPPFDVDRDGAPVDPSIYRNVADGNPRFDEDPSLRRAYREGYLEKLRFVNAQVLSYVDSVLAEVPDPKVIILHGDHGGGMLLDHEDLGSTCPRERFSPLLAVYSSDGRLQDALPEDLNLVNLYRVVFNELFDVGLPLLPSRHFFAPWSQPDRLEPLTPAQIRRTCPAPGVPSGRGPAAASPGPVP